MKLFATLMKTNKIIVPKIFTSLSLTLCLIMLMAIRSAANPSHSTSRSQSKNAVLQHSKKWVATVTAYCNNNGQGCKICNGKWAKYNKTADGHTPKQGVTCAASRKIPFGTKIYINGVGTRTVQDRLSPRFNDRIDIYFNNHSDALKFGKKKLNVDIR